VYAVRLRAGEGEDHVPFYVRPGPGTARAPIAFLAPTFSRPGDPVGARRGGVPN